MSTSVSLKPFIVRNRRNQSLQLATGIRERRVYLLNMTVEQANEFSGLKPEQWSALEEGWIPAMDNKLWIWWSLAGTLRVSVDRLFNLASADVARNEALARKEQKEVVA
jgi:hypothetical protein